MKIDHAVTPRQLLPACEQVFRLAAQKARAIDRVWDPADGAPVFTVGGRYTTRGWTEWTQGFQYGCLILAGDALDDAKLIGLGRRRTIEHMLPHVTHAGVHDHGFNNLSTYCNLLRLMHEDRTNQSEWEQRVYRDAIAASGAVQAARWADTSCGLGYVYSFNGPHSLFIDTMRSMRILGVAHRLGHVLMGENDRRISLLERSVKHGLATSRYIVFHGDSDHTYDVRGRTAHEGLFNRNDGRFRARSTQQGYSPFSTWTRGLAWAMVGYAEELEFFKTLKAGDFNVACGFAKPDVVSAYETCARQTCDHYIEDVTALDGITYWDDGAPGMAELEGWPDRPADPYNDHEPVDASASAIAAQGLIRLGNHLGQSRGKRYLQAGLTVARTLFESGYLSTRRDHQGLLLHSVYHRPNGWDHVPAGRKVPCDESSMWGDYHLLELAHLVARMAEGGDYPTFYACCGGA